MTLAIDAFNIALPQGTGVATYGRTLASAAAALGHDVGIVFGSKSGRSSNALLAEIGLMEGAPLASAAASWLATMRVAGRAVYGAIWPRQARAVPQSGHVIAPAHMQLGAAQFWNIQDLYRGANGLFHATGAFTRVRLPHVRLAHWTYPLPIAAQGACNVYTLHDLVPLRLPYTTADHKRVYYHLCRRLVDRADHILTVSEASRRDIIDILGADPARVSNLYQSTDIAARLKDISEAEIARSVEGLLGLGLKEYFLFFGAIEPKKNIARLLEAYLSSATTTPLVIVGAPGWGSDRDVELLKSLRSLDEKKRIIWLGFLPRNMLAMLIAGARAVLFPSLYEGFGLPVLEALSLGTPVMTSTTSSLPEVAGNAALLVDPYDVRAMTAAIRTLDADADMRADLARQGPAQATQFSDAAYQSRLQTFYKGIGI